MQTAHRAPPEFTFPARAIRWNLAPEALGAHSLFARTAFVTPSAAERLTFQPDFTLPDLPTFHADPGRDGTRGDGFVALHFGQRLGLIGGPPGHGRRVPLGVSRVLVRAALDGTPEATPTRRDHVFGLQVPGGVPDDLLRPRGLWPSAEAHGAQARTLARQFRQHVQANAGDVSAAVRTTPLLESAPS